MTDIMYIPDNTILTERIPTSDFLECLWLFSDKHRYVISYSDINTIINQILTDGLVSNGAYISNELLDRTHFMVLD